MQLLVSVSDAGEARAALAGGATIIDTKDPAAGALGPVSLDEFRRIHAVVAGRRPVSAAIGDAHDDTTIARAACDYARAGAAFVKIGFAGTGDRARLASLIRAAVTAVDTSICGVVPVAYADRIHSLEALHEFSTIAARAGAAGVLIDTAAKNGPGLRSLIAGHALTSWVAHSRKAGLFVSAAGKLRVEDIGWVRNSGADIAGVRGAACEAGRTSRLLAENVRQLCAAVSAVCAETTSVRTARSVSI